MLLSLQVRELAIIDAAEVSFGEGLNVVTGETGAGKSILIDALGLCLGARANPEVVRTSASQAEVTALFDVRGRADLRARLEEAGIGWDEELSVRRVVSGERGGGRSRAYLNGRLVSLTQLTQLTAGLADITSQHEQQTLTDPAGHLALLDASGQLEGLRAEVARAYSVFSTASAELESLLRELRNRSDREDLLRYQVKEIDELDLREGDEARWAADRERLRHASKLRDGTASAEDALYAGGGAVVDVLGRVVNELTALGRIDASLAGVLELVHGAQAHVEEASRELGRYARAVAADPERLAEVEDKLQKLGRLKRKYGATVEEILAFRAKAAGELERLVRGESSVQALEQRVEAARAEAAAVAKRLSDARRKSATGLGESISRELQTLGMGGARVVVEVQPTSPASGDLSVGGVKLLPTGIDRVEFLIAPNRGEEPRPLRRIASGGELSRALLAVKRVLTEVGEAGLYVFDEVDSGVGGAVAEVIGRKLKAIAGRHQVLVITHLPQIAAYADRHFVVGKRVVGERTLSEVHTLGDAARTEEIARMMGGIKVTDRTREAAAEMLRAATASP